MLSEKNNQILNSYERICDQIKSKARLVVVTKNQPIEHILPLLEAGHRHFGENRVQEALSKWPSLKEAYPDCCLHLIGPLQTNKIKQALSVFDVIETIDRERLVSQLPDSLSQPFYIQVNIGREPQKHGILPENLPLLLDLLREKNLWPKGLMTIPPADLDPAPFFTDLKNLANSHDLREVSMGMSHDYLIAIACGATTVRIGTGIFGERVSRVLSA